MWGGDRKPDSVLAVVGGVDPVQERADKVEDLRPVHTIDGHPEGKSVIWADWLVRSGIAHPTNVEASTVENATRTAADRPVIVNW